MIPASGTTPSATIMTLFYLNTVPFENSRTETFKTQIVRVSEICTPYVKFCKCVFLPISSSHTVRVTPPRTYGGLWNELDNAWGMLTVLSFRAHTHTPSSKVISINKEVVGEEQGCRLSFNLSR